MSDLATLFARNPLELTREDISTIVETMRKSRHAFQLGHVTAGRTKPLTEKQKQIKSLGDSLNISL